MKFILALFVVFSINSYAQYNDNFHVEPNETCSTGHCLVVNGSYYEILTYLDLEGFEVSSLNKKSDLIDVFNQAQDACFIGDQSKVHTVVNMMKSINEYYYSTGGHSLVTNLITTDLDTEVAVTFQYRTDYDGQDIFIRNVYVGPCLKFK